MELIQLLTDTFAVTNAEIGKLRLGIRQQAISIEANRLIRQRQLLEFQSNNCLMTDEERKNLEKQENEIQRKIFDVETCPEEKLFDVPAHAFNWHTLAVDEVKFLINLLIAISFVKL